MSEPSRLEKLQSMLSASPDDTFLRYGLAMELRKAERHDEALASFGELMQADPPYVPAFFMSGQLLVELGRIESARSALRDGIEQARSQGDSHAAAEMSELLASLGPQGE